MKILLAALAAILIASGLWLFLEGPLRDPADAMGDFLGDHGRFEDQLTDPLVLAGPRVRPLVLSAVADREMKLRRYALFYLGCAGYSPARETLRRILSDETELDYFRADALEALWRVDLVEGNDLAQAYQSRGDFLGEKAKQLIAGGPLADCRSWWSALIHSHG